ncbi:MAG: protein translocase subunit SecF [Acidimicrobiales bacterium]
MSVMREIFSGRSTIDFRPKWRITLMVSTLLLLGSIVLLLTRGLNLSIDFEGGAVWEVPVSADVTVAGTRDALPDLADAKIQLIEGSSGKILRVQSGTVTVDRASEISAELADLAAVDGDQVSTSTIGPTWGDRITASALWALGWFFLAVAIYLAWRLEWRMAIGALAAVVHDLVVTAGLYSLFGFEVSPATVIALLTILGYSLYDTVVVFDKVLENQRGPVGERLEDYDLVNQSMNQVLMRSINTTITTVLPVLSMLVIGGIFLGGASLRDFALALFVGLILGTYSSIFIAAPILVWLRSMRPEARRAAQIGAKRDARSGVERDRSAKFIDDRDGSLVTPGGSAPRPRKQGKRR